MTVQLVYVPEAMNFARDRSLGLHHQVYYGDPKSAELRISYDAISQEIVLPEVVGVISFNTMVKQGFRILVNARRKNSSTFYPLDVIEKAEAIMQKDHSNTMATHAAYRQLSYEIMHPAMDDSRPMYGLAPLITGQPNMDLVQDLLDQLSERSTEDQAFYAEMNDIVSRIPDPLERLANFVRNDFDRCQVSREFPLYYLPAGYLEGVSPEFSVVRPQGDVKIPEWAKGLKHYTEPIIPWLFTDSVAQTTPVTTLDELISKLDDPVTIITDSYLSFHPPTAALFDQELDVVEFDWTYEEQELLTLEGLAR